MPRLLSPSRRGIGGMSLTLPCLIAAWIWCGLEMDCCPTGNEIPPLFFLTLEYCKLGLIPFLPQNHRPPTFLESTLIPWQQS
jgi:hypothetical protein